MHARINIRLGNGFSSALPLALFCLGLRGLGGQLAHVVARSEEGPAHLPQRRGAHLCRQRRGLQHRRVGPDIAAERGQQLPRGAQVRRRVALLIGIEPEEARKVGFNTILNRLKYMKPN